MCYRRAALDIRDILTTQTRARASAFTNLELP